MFSLAAAVRAESRLMNVSVRSSAGSDSDTLIVGFSIAGSGPKRVLVRGIGPSLTPLGVPNAASDPALTLRGDAGVLASNDNWGGGSDLKAQFDAVGAFQLPAASLDAALTTTLSTGTCSALLESRSGGGVALVEVYDADVGNAASRFVNVSARSRSGPGADVLTVGFSIGGDSPCTVLIRAIGPALGRFGVAGTLADPKLRLFTGDGINIGSNDNWLSTAGWQNAFDAVGAFRVPTGSTDAAMVVKLPRGTYTAQASGVNDTTGVALVEVYELQTVPASTFVLEPVVNSQPAEWRVSPQPPGAAVVYPVPATRASPTYPFILRVAGIEGDAYIRFIVGPQGNVTDAYINHASDLRLGDSALNAVRQWIFKPGTINGTASSFLLEVPIIFTLTD
jgi:TonB family protein